ncbi:MAG: 50S ribosomal protein L21 [Planctomycetes bacterium]|nr:50S ribosomal protein L21 [Planctomycetota bacterium]
MAKEIKDINSKFAVIKDGGKQYEAKEGMKLNLELKNAKPGDEIELKDVLLYADGNDVKIGAPLVNGVTVKAKVEGEMRTPKVTSIRFHRRTGTRVERGHRQKYTTVKVTGILTA